MFVLTLMVIMILMNNFADFHQYIFFVLTFQFLKQRPW